ncbi:MAG: DUF499 domain-containing protein, partial [Ktedonobacteraceae bacterium]|nr:DUF499 domain-containing protein [Ktedonobacteraceae bacterium]
MAQSNHERVGRALDLLKAGLYPFIERSMQAVYGARWIEEVIANLQEHQVAALNRKDPFQDVHILLVILWDYWNAVFKDTLGYAERSLVSELRDVRNRWAHQQAFSSDDTYRALDSIQRLLTAVSASAQANEVGRQKRELQRISYEDQVRRETRKATTAPLEGKPLAGLPPWRNVVTPHPDVTSGRYLVSEFAADLGLVHKAVLGEVPKDDVPSEYLYPRDFFQRTYLTNGLSRLLVRALQRLSGQGGDPIVSLQTNFGGGKTHSLLALYHLFSGAPLQDLVGVERQIQEAGVERPLPAQHAVLVGHALSPGEPRTKPDGCVIRTLWGELAWQLLGRDGFAMVAEADRQGVSPGSDILREIFTVAAPCLILIDELVVYMRQIYHNNNLPAGSFDANLSFVQALTEAARTAPRTLVVATIPASDTETGGEGGREATVRLTNLFGRVESPWRPADAEEGFEIVRRRLFQDITDSTLFATRDAVARAFVNFYRDHAQDFPDNCRESHYEDRIKAAYPIHPELFDRLYTDWSSIDNFQRTRGVLRLMAKVVHRLWQSEDKNLLILPASVAVGDAEIKSELAKYLEDNWDPVIEKDIDGQHALSLRLDADNPTLGRVAACRRVARTIFLGSAPNPRKSNKGKGLTEKLIRLGCVQPGENISTFGDALRRLSDQSSHLYLDGQQYWYATQPSVTRLAQDRAAQYDDDHVYAEIEKRLSSESNTRADFARVHPAPASSALVPDDDTAVRLVILRPQVTHSNKDQQSSAWNEAQQMLETRGNSPRIHKNTLIFLAADRTGMESLKAGVRQYLAWDSIYNEHETLNLDAFGRKLAQTKRDDANSIVKARIPEAYIWLLVPTQEKLRPITLLELRLQPQAQSPEPLASAVNCKLENEELLVVQFGSTLLRQDLDTIPLWRGNHVAIKTLAEDYAKYVYLTRLKNSNVLLGAIRDGVQSLLWEQETFAYAESFDEERQRYLGLKAGQQITLNSVEAGLLVKPEVAAAQIQADAEEARRRNAQQPAGGVSPDGQPGLEPPGPKLPKPPVTSSVAPPTAKQMRRFYGAVRINPRMMGSDAGRIMEEVVKHLTSLSKEGVQVTLEIQANI